MFARVLIATTALAIFAAEGRGQPPAGESPALRTARENVEKARRALQIEQGRPPSEALVALAQKQLSEAERVFAALRGGRLGPSGPPAAPGGGIVILGVPQGGP
jgi:hypothetical protein